VNVAEDRDDAGSVEAHGAIAPGREAAEIERTNAGERKDVVERRVVVRKVDDRTGWNGEDARQEALAALIHARASRLEIRKRLPRRRLEIDDDACAIDGRTVGCAKVTDGGTHGRLRHIGNRDMPADRAGL